MYMNRSRLFAATAVAGLVAAGGSAVTESNTIANSVAGYGTSTVSGATATSVVHTLSADGTTIRSTLITFSASVQNRTVKAAFGSADLESCTVGASPFTTATCTYASPYYDTATAQAFNVAVS